MVLRSILIILVLVGLSACQRSIYNPLITNQRTSEYLLSGTSAGAALGTTTFMSNPSGLILGGIIGGYTNSENKLVSDLQKLGARVIQIGDTTSILIPVDQLFEPKDDVLVDRDYPILDLSARLLNKFGNAAIKVAVGTDDVDTTARNYDLTKRQAEQISAYLWHQGIAIQRLFPIAYGPKMLLADNRRPNGSAYNRVIEITVNPYVLPNACCRKLQHALAKTQPWQYWGIAPPIV